MHRAVRKKLDRKVKSQHTIRVLTEKQEANKSSRTVRFCPLYWIVAVICDLSSGAKVLFAKMIFDAWGGNCCRVGVNLQAKSLGVDRGTIRGWIRELQLKGLIRVRREWACCCYYLNPKYKRGGFIPLLAETMKRRDVGWTYKLLLCLLSYQQGENDCCWAKQKSLAEDLGCSVRTIQRELARMKARGEVQIRLRGRNRKHGNKYALTCGALLGGRVFGASSHTTKSPPLYKNWKAKIGLKAFRPKFLSGDLSERSLSDGFGMDAVFFELVNVPMHDKVARSLAFIDKHPLESAVNAITNARIKCADVFKRADNAGLPRPKFNVAGYVVNSLNGARREGKTVGTTKLVRDTETRSRVIKIIKARRQKWKPPSDEVFADRVRKAKHALGVRTWQKENEGNHIIEGSGCGQTRRMI